MLVYLLYHQRPAVEVIRVLLDECGSDILIIITVVSNIISGFVDDDQFRCFLALCLDLEYKE